MTGAEPWRTLLPLHTEFPGPTPQGASLCLSWAVMGAPSRGKRVCSPCSLSFQPLNGARFHGDMGRRLGIRGGPPPLWLLLVASVTWVLSPRFISFCLLPPLLQELKTCARGRGQEHQPLHLYALPTLSSFTRPECLSQLQHSQTLVVVAVGEGPWSVIPHQGFLVMILSKCSPTWWVNEKRKQGCACACGCVSVASTLF